MIISIVSAYKLLTFIFIRILILTKTSSLLFPGVVDTDALYQALKEKWIFAAGLDVVAPEPIHKDHPIVSLPNCCKIILINTEKRSNNRGDKHSATYKGEPFS